MNASDEERACPTKRGRVDAPTESAPPLAADSDGHSSKTDLKPAAENMRNFGPADEKQAARNLQRAMEDLLKLSRPTGSLSQANMPRSTFGAYMLKELLPAALRERPLFRPFADLAVLLFYMGVSRRDRRRGTQKR
jgi:hypothetical protein